MAAQTKTCTNPDCEQQNPQPLSAFSKHKCKYDGLASRCRECKKASDKKHYAANRNRILAQVTAYSQTEAAKEKIRIRENARGKSDWEKLRDKLAKRLHGLTIGGQDTPLNNATMGCTYAEIRAHIEDQFEDWMSWDNYGEWEFDHIVPYKAFPTVEELEKDHKLVCWYKNVRPLSRTHNRQCWRDYKEEDKQGLIQRYQLWEIEREVLALI